MNNNRRTKTEVKHHKMAKEIVKGISPKHAYMKVYPKASEKTAESRSSQLMKRDYIKNDIIELFNKSKLKDRYIAKKLYNLTNAQKENANGDLINDNAAQLRAIETVLRVKGHLSTNNSPHNVDNRSVTINMNKEDIGDNLNMLTESLLDLNQTLKIAKDKQTGDIASVSAIRPDAVIDGEIVD